MHPVIQPIFFIVIRVVPAFMICSLFLIWQQSDNSLLHVMREAAIIFAIWGAPVLFGVCLMNPPRFVVPHLDPSKFRPEIREKMAARAVKVERFMLGMNKAYEAYWTADNRVVCAMLAFLSAAFGFNQMLVWFNQLESVFITAGFAVSVTVMVALVIINSRLGNKATT